MSVIDGLNPCPQFFLGFFLPSLFIVHVPLFSMFQSPVFLLFLDCVWQVLRQRPRDFEFTQTFLTAIWHSAHVSVFDTFLFDCVKDRENMIHVRMNCMACW